MASPPSTRAYGIVSPQYLPFDGSGTRRWGSRWISPGQWVVHAAETYSLAVLENLVHWRTSALPPNLACVAVDIPDSLGQEELDRSGLPSPVRDDYEHCRAVGDDWYRRAETAVLWVPSIVSPHELNVLFNQQHVDFSEIIVHEPVPAHVDPRLQHKKKN